MDGDIPFGNLLKGLTSIMSDFVSKQIDNAIEGSEAGVNKILDTIHYNLERFRTHRKTYIKYLWIRLFFLWVTNKDNNTQKRFEYFGSSLIEGNKA